MKIILTWKLSLIFLTLAISACGGSTYQEFASTELQAPTAGTLPVEAPVVSNPNSGTEPIATIAKGTAISMGSSEVKGNQVMGSLTIGSNLQSSKGLQLSGEITISPNF
jgi:hypothetical protein